MVAHILFVTSRVRKDINMAIAFIYTRVRILYKYDWGNLVRVIRYIRGTLHLPPILSANSLTVIKLWVDASFATHPYCNGAYWSDDVNGIRVNNVAIIDEGKREDINRRRDSGS